MAKKPKEATIVINGIELTKAQAITVRVALENYADELRTDGLGEDEGGRAICAGYLLAIKGIREALYRT